MPTPLLIAKGAGPIHLIPSMATRHGLIAGATGTGKTVTLQVLSEQFSSIGVPVFLADVKGDLSGISEPGTPTPRVQQRISALRLDPFEFSGFPVTFWDVFGTQGHPVRSTISEIGPLLLARLLQLNPTQAGVLNLVFRVADENGLLLLDLKDLRSILKHVGDNAAQFTTEYGNISAASIGAIQRNLLVLDQQGAEKFFAEPALNLDDLLQTDPQGRGIVNILAADKLFESPQLYATLLLWLLSELFENLPEAGDLPKPKLVFFFDEAHLLFSDTPPALIEKIEQVVRLIRSKGVGVYFVTQNPRDVPDAVLGQLGNRVQHALRAFTPQDQKAVRAAAETFRANPRFDTSTAITELAVGEALISFLDVNGQPSVVERAFVTPPRSQMGPIGPEARMRTIQSSVLFGAYEKVIDRDSAYELLKRNSDAAQAAQHAAEQEGQHPSSLPLPRPAGRVPDGLLTMVAKSAARSIGSSVGREIIRGVLGSLFGSARRRR